MSLLRRRVSQSRADEAGVDMTPMLDIVFIMLIFFIVTAVFMDETALDFTQAPDGTSPPTPDPTISIVLDAKNQITVDNVYADLSAVTARVESLLSAKPDAAILLTASAQASWDPVVAIKDDMKAAGRPLRIEVTQN